MDVQAAAAPTPGPIAPPQPAPAPDLDAAAAGPAPAPTTVTAGSTAGSGTTTPAHATTDGSSPSAPASNQKEDTTLSPVVAKLFNAAAGDVEVSFQVLHNPDEVVTVFTDRSTGKEIIQFPSQTLIALAEMYDKDAGKVLDKTV